MHSRRDFLGTAAGSTFAAATRAASATERDYWIRMLLRIADPVLAALSERKLKATMPVEAPHGNAEDRKQYTYLEALGRLLCGMSSWLESGEDQSHEGELRQQYAELARRSIAAAVDPASPDFMNFNHGSQPVVDAAFLALAVLRAPVELWEKLDARTKQQLIAALRSSRVIRPGFNNWLLFSATVEAFFCRAGEPWDAMRVDYAIRQHEEWYKGDGIYGDGPPFHWDYYNSFVIQPMLLAVVEAVSKSSKAWEPLYPAIVTRAMRYAAIEERLISPEGTFPAVGRSLAYRFGVFHHLANMALRRQLPENVAPEQVRAGLSAVLHRMLEAPGTFDPDGWLTVGFCGHQPAIAESYISTGSLYLCSAGFLPLGLPAVDPFWSKPTQPWTQKKIWNGENTRPDHGIQV
ncbi:MAG TPA: DUF2264 domain-containing protein [Bryobacteraceae bacterium]|nr:DUF2264 domain-containing protein [Bryobacteraceae bacterium]